ILLWWPDELADGNTGRDAENATIMLRRVLSWRNRQICQRGAKLSRPAPFWWRRHSYRPRSDRRCSFGPSRGGDICLRWGWTRLQSRCRSQDLSSRLGEAGTREDAEISKDPRRVAPAKHGDFEPSP